MGKTCILIVLLICCMAGVSCSGSGTSNFAGNSEASLGDSGFNTTIPPGTTHNPDALEQVLALEPPGGVDANLFAELQNELARQVSTRTSQQMQSHTPIGEANRVCDLLYDGMELSWAYTNTGDYDLNGEVNGSDIAPIAVHFGKTSDSPDWLVAKVADGDGNGEVNLGDIASVAINFGSCVQGYVVLGGENEAAYPSDPSELGGSGSLHLGGVILSSMETDPAGRPMLNFATHIQLDTNLYWVRPVYDDLLGDASYPSTNVGEGLDFHVQRLNEFNLHDPALDDSFIVIPEQTADEITLEIWATDTEAEEYVAFNIGFDQDEYSPISSQRTITGAFKESRTNLFQNLITYTEAIVVVSQRSDLIIFNGSLAKFSFSMESSGAPQGHKVGSALVNSTYYVKTLDESNELEGFTVNRSEAQEGNPANFTIYSVFMMGDGDDNGKVDLFDLTQIYVQGNVFGQPTDTNFAPAATDYDQNCEPNISDANIIVFHSFEAVDSIEILIWDTGEYADEAPAMTFGFIDGTPSKRHESYPFTATDWRDVFRTWDGEISIGMMQAADLNGDGEVLVSARLRYEDQLGLPFTGLPFTYTE